MSSKGEGVMEQSTIMILLILIGAVVIFLAIAGSVGNAKNMVMHKMCTWSLVFKDKFILGTNLCYTDDKKIDGKSKDEVMGGIAEKMVECWERMDEGRTPIDKNWLIGGHTCFKCYRLKIPDLKEKISYGEFYRFLIEHNVKGKEENYYNFFKKYDDKNNVFLVGGNKDLENLNKLFIDPDKYDYYAIAFKGAVPVSSVTKGALWTFTGVATVVAFASGVGELATLGTIAVGSVNVGAFTLLSGEISELFAKHNSIILMPYDQFDEVCPSTIK